MKIIQCWDDGVANDAPLADLLRKYGAKATFNINPALYKKDRRVVGWRYAARYDVERLCLDEMKDVYHSFRIASHTMTHPNPSAIRPEEFRREAVDARHFIEDFFQVESPGFAYPFGQFNDTCKDILRSEKFLYARTVGSTEHVFPPDDPMAFHPSCHFQSEHFSDLYRKAKDAGEPVFYFWGHSYELEDDPRKWAEFEQKIAMISGDASNEWVDIPDLFIKS